MNSEDQFKKSLQDKIASKEFPFDENEWDKAAAIIDTARKGGNRGFIYFLSGLLIVLAGYLSFQSMPQQSNESSNAKSNLADNREHVLMAEKQFSDQTKVISHSVPETKPEPKPNSIKTTLPKSLANTQKEEVLIQSVPTQKIVQTSPSSQPAETSSASSEESEQTALNIPSENLTPNQNPLPPVRATINAGPSHTESVNEAETPLMSTTESASLVSLESVVSTLNSEKETSLTNASETNSEQKSLIEKSDSIMKPLLATAVKDSSKLQNQIVSQTHNRLNFEFGASYMFGWKNDQGRDANGINPVIGLNYSSNIFKNYWFSLGVQYTSVRNLSTSSKTSKVTRYKLGEESDVTTITPSTLHYLSVPFKAHYQYNESNAFGVSYVMNYLFNVESKVDTYTQTIYGTTNSLTYSTGGYTEGFRLFSSQVGLFYNRQLYKELWLNAEFVFGLNDIKEDSFFKLNSVERNTGLKITLTYNLFKH